MGNYEQVIVKIPTKVIILYFSIFDIFEQNSHSFNGHIKHKMKHCNFLREIVSKLIIIFIQNYIKKKLIRGLCISIL